MDPSDLALDLARRAGETMSTNFSLAASRSWKSDGTPLTTTDVAINEMVVEGIAAAFPEHAVIGEEQSSIGNQGAEWAWICDPVDGTVPSSHGIPVSTFSLALTRNGVPEIAVVVDPFLRRTFFAERGKGATLNGTPMQVSTTTSVENTVITLEVPPGGANGSAIRDDLQSDRTIVLSFWSYVYGGCLVGAGELSAAIYSGKRPWDTAAVCLLVEEAGGKVTDLEGNEQRYDGTVNGLVATNGHVHDRVLEAVKRGL